MSLVNIPAIAYIDGGTRNMTLQIIADDNAYQSLKNKWVEIGSPITSYTTIATWSKTGGYTTSEAHQVINDYLNSFVISNKLKFYLANTTTGADLTDLMHDFSVLGIMPTLYTLSTNLITHLYTLDNVDLKKEGLDYPMGHITYNSESHQAWGDSINYYNQLESFDSRYGTIILHLTIYPSDIFSGNDVTGGSYSDENDPVFNIDCGFSVNGDVIEGVSLSFAGWQKLNGFASIVDFFEGVNINTPGTTTDDIENPYGYEGNSTTGGGHGKFGDIDGIEATEVPDLPTINAASLGLITLYNPTASVINSLAQFLWSGMFDPASFKKLFADPMGCLIGLSIVPAIPTTGGSKNIRFGSVDTGINCSYLSSNYCNVDCGSLSVDEYVGSFLDYDPYCKISIYLPYCGFHTLSADDLVGGSINVQYNIDVLSGNCIAFIAHSEKGVLYSFSGTCLTNVPLTGQSFSGALEAYYTGLAGVAGSALGALGTGGAGLVATAGNAASAAMNTMFNSKPDFQRSGSTGGAAGIMGVQTPFLVIERPRFSVPNQVQKYVGQTSNISMYLGNCKGFTMVEYIHLHGVTGTSEEVKEIEALLKEGVIL